MKKMKSYIFAALCFTSIIANAQSTTHWKTARTKNDIQICYRWVTSKDNKKAREMRTVFTIDSDIPSIVGQINNASNYVKWSKSTSKCDITLYSQKHWETYTLYDLPWPLKSKDLFTKSELIETEKHSIIKTVSYPEIIPEYKNIKRIRSYSAEWKLIPLLDNKTKVVLKTISYDKAKFPRLLTDPIIQNKMMESIELLRKQILL